MADLLRQWREEAPASETVFRKVAERTRCDCLVCEGDRSLTQSRNDAKKGKSEERRARWREEPDWVSSTLSSQSLPRYPFPSPIPLAPLREAPT